MRRGRLRPVTSSSTSSQLEQSSQPWTPQVRLPLPADVRIYSRAHAAVIHTARFRHTSPGEPLPMVRLPGFESAASSTVSTLAR